MSGWPPPARKIPRALSSARHPAHVHDSFPFSFFKYPTGSYFIFEGATHVWREVFTDERPHPADVNPTFLGDATGRWDGDTLVVDTVGFNEESWLDQDGHPHTEALHTIERFTRINAVQMRYEVTIDDPKAYTANWTPSYLIPWAPAAELMEYICQENNKDVFHLGGGNERMTDWKEHGVRIVRSGSWIATRLKLQACRAPRPSRTPAPARASYGRER